MTKLSVALRPKCFRSWQQIGSFNTLLLVMFCYNAIKITWHHDVSSNITDYFKNEDNLLTWNSDVTVAFRLIYCTVDMVFARKITLAATPLHLLSAGNIPYVDSF